MKPAARIREAQAQPQETAQAAAAERSVRWLPILGLGAGIAVLNAAWMTYMEIMWNQGYATLLSLFYNVVFTLVVILLLNSLIHRRSPALALTRAELLLLFIMGSVGTSLAMTTEYLMSVLAFPYHHGHLDNRWETSLFPYLPKRLTVSDPHAVKSYYLGHAELWNASALRPWLWPFVGWGIFILATVWTGICLSALVYNQWRHQEKMPFPLIQIPLMITEPRATFWRSRLFWIGFALASGINILNALNRVYPFIPPIPVKRQDLYMPGLSRPWSALSPVMYSTNPLLIGLEYFLPLDLLFSLFFFYWAGRMEGVLLDYLGFEQQAGADGMVAPYVREQAFGALMVLLLFAFWTSRRRWRESWMRYRMFLPWQGAVKGALVGAAVMVGVLLFTGMPAYLAILFVAIYLAVALSLCRIRAQYGPPVAGLLYGAPGPVLYAALGRDGIGTPGLSSLAVTHWLGREFSDEPMLPTLEGFALAERRTRTNILLLSILLAALMGYVTAFGTALVTGYRWGHASAHVSITQFYFGNEAYALFSKRLSDPVSGPHFDSLGAIGLGAVLTLVLQNLRTRFIGFPLHPVGYAVASSYISTFVWSTAMLVWLFKGLLLRYAGLKGYYVAAPFFLGLLLGEFVVGSLISLIGVLLGTEMYVFWPY
jgi:hypothetical protein